ncbi:unnamed protein product [Protopolystoma xenopodis]|uniref:Uncharacterized protein n=1 Tax=Protopolystoma xenopodis TaxID=117903 RepID=A0A448X3S3_9PLAT|nr:unnamed protein product [Protopolystoma xenopodis]
MCNLANLHLSSLFDNIQQADQFSSHLPVDAITGRQSRLGVGGHSTCPRVISDHNLNYPSLSAPKSMPFTSTPLHKRCFPHIPNTSPAHSAASIRPSAPCIPVPLMTPRTGLSRRTRRTPQPLAVAKSADEHIGSPTAPRLRSFSHLPSYNSVRQPLICQLDLHSSLSSTPSANYRKRPRPDDCLQGVTSHDFDSSETSNLTLNKAKTRHACDTVLSIPDAQLETGETVGDQVSGWETSYENDNEYSLLGSPLESSIADVVKTRSRYSSRNSSDSTTPLNSPTGMLHRRSTRGQSRPNL